MARNGSNEAARRNAAGVEAVEGLLAYAQTQARGRFGGAAKSVREAVAISRELAARDPALFIPLLARSLCAKARLVARRRPAEALPVAEEAVMLTRSVGGGPLVLALGCLADILTALGHHAAAANALAEADKAAQD